MPVFRHHRPVPTGVSLATPACRTLVVEVCVDLDSGDVSHEFLPVLAIQAAVTGDGIELEPVVADECADGLVSLDYLSDTVNTVYMTRAAPWPPDADEARLAPVVAELTRRAREKVARHKALHPASHRARI